MRTLIIILSLVTQTAFADSVSKYTSLMQYHGEELTRLLTSAFTVAKSEPKAAIRGAQKITNKLYFMNFLSQKICASHPKQCQDALGTVLKEAFVTALDRVGPVSQSEAEGINVLTAEISARSQIQPGTHAAELISFDLGRPQAQFADIALGGSIAFTGTTIALLNSNWVPAAVVALYFGVASFAARAIRSDYTWSTNLIGAHVGECELLLSQVLKPSAQTSVPDRAI